MATKKKVMDMTYEEKLAALDKKIEKSRAKIEMLSSSISKARKNVIFYEAQRKALRYDNEHPS